MFGARTCVLTAACAALAAAAKHNGQRGPVDAPVFVDGQPTAQYTLSINVTRMTEPRLPANVGWSGIKSASKGDWVGVCCGQPTGGYFWWYYTSGQATDNMDINLWANSAAAGCDSIYVTYYSGSNAVLATSPLIPVDPMIQQVHLSLVPGHNDAMVVEFVSSGSGSAPSCTYGQSAANMSMRAVATSFTYPTIGLLAQACLTGLLPATRYFYACTDGAVSSGVYSFVNQQDARAPVIAMFADFGVDDGFGLDQISADAQSGVFDLVLHAGDFAYDFDSSNSANGNFFMNRGMVYGAYFATMPAPGNHEAGANFTEYKVRFAGVGNNSNSGASLFYSFEWQGVHFLAFNSETYIDGGVEQMVNFMTSDLAGVNRGNTPWVVAFAHKLWWMDSTDFSSISGVLQGANVDLLLAGHWHLYSRMIPYDPVTSQADTACLSADNHTYTDPTLMTMIICGAPGDVERNDACPPDASLDAVTPECSSSYGYGTFTPFNGTHLYWQFTAVQTPIGGVGAPITYQDHLWIVRSKAPVA